MKSFMGWGWGEYEYVSYSPVVQKNLTMLDFYVRFNCFDVLT